jgi:cysteine desulfurase
VGEIGSTILHDLEVVAASTGSACHSLSVELSPVLKAMNIPPEVGMGAIRFSLGRTMTPEEIEQVVSRLQKHQVRGYTPERAASLAGIIRRHEL